jgi:transaldolase
MTDKLTQLKTMTQVVADSGDIEAIREFRPLDATTNPSLLLKAAALPHYAELLQAAQAAARAEGGSEAELLASCCDHFAVAVGREILGLVPGRVSTEVDARLSFDSVASAERARRIIGLYEDAGVNRDRILIKLASTWEGVRAAEELEKDGINCNLTLLFGFSQAQACADAGVFLISPFVGRILDWYKANTDTVRRIYAYYKTHGYDTVVMGASFRNAGEIEALAGCDRLTISPALLQELADDTEPLERILSPDNADSVDTQLRLSESAFRYAVNDDAMATEKLAEGIRNFVADQQRLEQMVRDA